MYPIPPTEKLVETKICKHCGTDFPITDKDLEFYEKVSPVFAGVKCSIPAPTLCPDCRQQRRLSFRNERKLYKRKCDATGRDIISIYSPDKPLKVYHQDEWWSDKWDPLSYGRDFDFARPFFEQFGELMKEVPRMGLVNKQSVNSEYTNDANNNKDCYLCFGVDNSENSNYLSIGVNDKSCIDGLWLIEWENLYECSYCINASQSFFCRFCSNIRDCFACINCIGCSNCFGSKNLINQEYVFFGQQISKTQYEQNLKELRENNNLSKILQKIHSYFLTLPSKQFHIVQSENYMGDILQNSSSIWFSFWIEQGERLKYCYDIFQAQNSQDLWMVAYGTEFSYELSTSIGKTYKTAFCNFLNEGKENLYYLSDSIACSDCFACVGLCNKQYCVFNKQYSKEEYETLVPKIIEHMITTGEWGEFFPSSISPFGYNETVAQEYFPMTREQTISKGFNWSDYEPPFPKVEKTIPASKLPENIDDVPDDILNWAIECEVTGKPFRIIKQELEFYRKHHLPIPKRHPDQRHLDRMALRNPRKLFERKCDKCNKEMITTYGPERPETVYCEECYEREIVG